RRQRVGRPRVHRDAALGHLAARGRLSLSPRPVPSVRVPCRAVVRGFAVMPAAALVAVLLAACGSSDNTAQDPGCPVGQQAACSTSSGAGGSSAATSPSAAAACPTPAASSGTDSFAATVALTTAGDGL